MRERPLARIISNSTLAQCESMGFDVSVAVGRSQQEQGLCDLSPQSLLVSDETLKSPVVEIYQP
jgi:hypothetical protein